jgi:hypothetical protein
MLLGTTKNQARQLSRVAEHSDTFPDTLCCPGSQLHIALALLHHVPPCLVINLTGALTKHLTTVKEKTPALKHEPSLESDSS